MKLMEKRALVIALVVIALFVGFYFGRSVASENITTNYSCGDIARFHADILMKNYGIEFNTDQSNPRRDINQRASDFNARLLTDCLADPTK